MPESLRRGTGTALKLLLLAAAGFYAFFIFRTSFRIRDELYFTLIDDAMVSMRYAHHLAQGYGLVWNVGERPVEGFTNPGWMLYMALLHILGLPLSKISLAVMITAGAILLANSIVIYRICEEINPRSQYAPLLAATISAFYFPLVFWSLRGMEVSILTLLISTATLLSVHVTRTEDIRSAALLGSIFFLALLVRLDALPQIAVIMTYVVLAGRLKGRMLAVPMLVALFTTLGILWGQHAYFGDFLPNTYYQKVAGAPVAERIKYGVLAFSQHATRDMLMMSLVSLVALIWYRILRNRDAALMAGLFAIQCAYSIWVGGDYAEPEVDAANRFITQGMPFLIILFSLALDQLISDLGRGRRATAKSPRAWRSVVSVGVAAAALLVISGKPWLSWATDNAPLLKADIRRVRVGLAIAKYTSPDATIAVHAAGQIPYYSNRRTIDLLGLNDPVVAKGPMAGAFYPGHDKWDYNYSITHLKPDLIADNWIRLGSFMKDNPEYQQLDNGMYVRRDSTLVDAAGLSQPYR